MSGTPNGKRILLGQLASNGDCLYATTLARQIKVDYPGCHLTWAIAPAYRPILEGNPDVDAVWEIPYYTTPGDAYEWRRFELEAMHRKEGGDFDEIFLTQISPGSFHLWVGSVRSCIFRNYPHPVTVDVSPVLRLSSNEVNRVSQFAESHRLAEKSQVILFECAPRSGQSLVNPQFALDVARKIVEKHPQVTIVLSSNHSFDSDSENIIDGSVLSLRENAELTKYCSLLIGASSGVSWVSTSDWAKPLPMIQLVIADVALSNSLLYDFQKRGADTSRIIEMHSYTVDDVCDCVSDILVGGFEAAKRRFGQVTPLRFEHYQNIQHLLIRSLRWKKALVFLRLNIKEYGFHPQFIFLAALLLVKAVFKVPVKMGLALKRFVVR